MRFKFAAIIAVALLCGCQHVKVSESLTGKLGGSDAGAQMEFWHQLAEKPSTCNDEAFHGFLLYLDGQDGNANYDARVTTMKSRGLLPPGFSGAANDTISRGDLAVVIVRSLKIKGGLTNQLLQSSSPRYATRELIYLSLYPPASSPNQTFSGSEFVGIIGRIEDWQRGNAVDRPAEVLSGESK